MRFKGVREVTTFSTSSSPMLLTCMSPANSATTSTVNVQLIKHLMLILPRPKIILPAASARSRSTPSMMKKKCRSWTKPSTSLDSSGMYIWGPKCKQNNSQIPRDEKIDVYRVTSCCMVLSQLEFQVLKKSAMLPPYNLCEMTPRNIIHVKWSGNG